MNWDMIGAIAELVGALAVVLTLAYLALQVKQSNLAGSVSAKQEMTRQFADYSDLLLQNPILHSVYIRGLDGEELDATEARKTLRYAYALGVFGIATTLGLLRFYVLPYQKALFADEGEFRFEWFSGEGMFAYCWAIIFCFLTWLMRRAIHSYYLPKKTKASIINGS